MTTPSDNRHDDSDPIPYFGPPDHFGGCPKCGGTGVYVNIDSDHYFLCEQHRVYWYVGSNLFSAWRMILRGNGRRTAKCWKAGPGYLQLAPGLRYAFPDLHGS